MGDQDERHFITVKYKHNVSRKSLPLKESVVLNNITKDVMMNPEQPKPAIKEVERLKYESPRPTLDRNTKNITKLMEGVTDELVAKGPESDEANQKEQGSRQAPLGKHNERLELYIPTKGGKGRNPLETEGGGEKGNQSKLGEPHQGTNEPQGEVSKQAHTQGGKGGNSLEAECGSQQEETGNKQKQESSKKRKKYYKEGKQEKKIGNENRLKVGSWNAAESATQNFEKIVNRVAITMEDLKMDILGIVEANIYPNTIKDGLKIAGYNMEVGRGVEKEVGANARVIMYITTEIDYKRRRDLEEMSEMPTVWIEVGTKGKGKFLCCTVYREQKHWGGSGEDLRMVNQRNRWREWLETLVEVWEGEEEAIVMGDFNIDMERKESGMKARMQSDVRSQVINKDWRQLISTATRKTKATGKDWVSSKIDWILTNKPERIQGTGVEWIGSGADHALVWAEKEMGAKFRRTRKTRKRIWKEFTKERLEEEATNTCWDLHEGDGEEEDIEKMVETLEMAIKKVMEKVAPMKTVVVKKARNRWLSQSTKKRIQEVRGLQLKYLESGSAMHKEAWKKERRSVGAEIKKAKKKYTQKGLKDKEKCSKTMWQGVKDHLGWESTGAPTRLEIQTNEKNKNVTRVLVKPEEVAEAITKAFEEKGEKVKKAIGEPEGNYLKEVNRLHNGNVGKFTLGEIAEKDVRERLRKVDNKPSYGEDEISYTDLKLLEKWVIKPLTRIFQLSLEKGTFPTRWKSSRIKPLWKGEGNPKEKPESYRPVALLSAMGRLLEGIVAERMDEYAESRGLVHKQVHGFRKHRGVGTGMLKLWEDVLKDGGTGKKVVALAFLDVSAGFDSVPHTQLMRKLEAVGYDKGALKWLSNYLTGRSQYVVVEATDGRKYGMPVGTPQGGALGPSMWREYTNDLPESCMGVEHWEDENGEGGENWGNPVETNPKTRRGQEDGETQTGVRRETKLISRESKYGHQCEGWGEAGGNRGNPVEAGLKPTGDQGGRTDEWDLSHWVDNKPVQGKEEEYDRSLRKRGLISGREREDGVEGPDRLNYRGGKRQGERECVLYADDTTAKVTGEVWPELEVKLTRMLSPMFANMKEDRLKVNEDKTGLIIVGDRKARRRLLRGGGTRTLELSGKIIEPETMKKSLGLIISENMNWTDQVNDTIRKCKFKLRSLRKLKGVVNKCQRKKLAEGVILSRLNQHLEIVSTGRKVDLDALQRVQNATMMWVGGEGRRAFRVETAKEQTGWLDMGQVAAKATILQAMKVMYEDKQEGILEKIAVKDKQGKPRVKNVSKEELEKQSVWMRKSWSTRARRWLKMMPEELRERNPWKESTKKAIKRWVKENVGSRGDDHILWGRWQTVEAPEGGEVQKRKKPPTSNKQMKKLGEPSRKERKEEVDTKDEPGKKGVEEKSNTDEKKPTRKEENLRREERRLAREVRRKKTKDNKLKKEKKKKLAREKLENEGLKRNKNQMILREWLRGGSMELPKQSEARGGKDQGRAKKGIG